MNRKARESATDDRSTGRCKRKVQVCKGTDFLDITLVTSVRSIWRLRKNKNTSHIFLAKRLPLLIEAYSKYREFHRGNFLAVKDT